MLLITAIIQPPQLEQVMAALGAAGITGMTVSQASGWGHQRGHTEVYRGTGVAVALVPKVRCELVVGQDLADEVVATIVRAAGTGTIGDGKVWTTPVIDVVRVRTAERGEAAL